MLKSDITLELLTSKGFDLPTSKSIIEDVETICNAYNSLEREVNSYRMRACVLYAANKSLNQENADLRRRLIELEDKKTIKEGPTL